MPPPAISSTTEPDGAGDADGGAEGGGLVVGGADGTAVIATGVAVGSAGLEGDGAADGLVTADTAAV